MQDIFFRIHVIADPSRFDRDAAIGAVCSNVLALALKNLPGLQVPVLAWGAAEREADAAEIKLLRAELKKAQQGVQNTQELQELRHTVQKLEAQIKELEAAKECKHEEVIDLPDAAAPAAEADLAAAVEEPAVAEEAVPAEEVGEQPQQHRRKRVR